MARQAVQQKGKQLIPSASGYAEALRHCCSLDECEKLHDRIIDSGLETSAFPGNLLIKAYAKHGRVDRARKIFSGLIDKNLYSWSIMFSAFAQNGQSREALQLFKQMREPPDLLTFTMAFGACSRIGSLAEAQNLYARFVSSGLRLDACAQNALIYMFAECGSLRDARRIFDAMATRNVISWNTILAAYGDNEQFGEVLHLLKEFDLEGFHPDSVTFLAILGACSDLTQGKKIHSRAVASGFNSTVLQTAFLHMYARCGSLQDGREIFDRMQQKDLVSFNAMIGVHSQSGSSDDAVLLYRELDLEGFSPNAFTYVGVLTACCSLGNLKLGQEVHARVLCSGARPNFILDNALLNMYARCGSLVDAKKVFDAAQDRREVSSWNAMIAAYALHDRHKEAIEAFHRMDLEPNSVTFTNVVTACSILGSLEEARRAHSRVQQYRIPLELVTENSLVKMYAQCGSLEDAERAFEMICRKDSSSWNSMIAAYVESGESLKGLRLLRRMDVEGMKLDVVTLLQFVTACATAGSSSLAESKKIHARITGSIGKPGVTIHNALINMYARCGSLDNARSLFEEAPIKNDASWNAIMAAYAQHGRGAEALELFHRMELQGEVPCDITVTIVLLACSHAGLHDDAWYHLINTSSDYGVKLGSMHYHCMIDLLGRAGLLEEAQQLMSSMPYEARGVGWRGFLGACKTHGEGTLGALAAEQLVSIQPDDASPYMLLSGI